jgi:hypothetical protein
VNQNLDLTYLQNLKPCENILQNFINYHNDFNGTWEEFLDLPNISYEDKVWVAKRYLSINQLVHWSVLCAESVKIIFTARYPKNKSLQNLFDYLRVIPDFTKIDQKQKDKILELRKEVRAAADAAAAYAAAYAAAAAAYAAAYAAADAADAAYAYADAAAAAAAADAADADADADAASADADADAAYADADADAAYADADAAARGKQQKLNIEFLKAVVDL